MNQPLIVAHRGSSDRHPDNSWAAYRAALDEGADAIECDVQATRDGELIVRHDLALDGRLVVDLSLAELTAVEPETLRLAELLAWAEREAIGLLVELKDPDAAGPVADMLAQTRERERIVVGGFHGPALAHVKACGPVLRTSLMVGSVLEVGDLAALARAYRADGVHPCWESRAPRPHRLLDAAAVARLRAAGLAVTLWHEERETELIRLVELGADAICTNTPDRLRRIVDRRLGVGAGD